MLTYCKPKYIWFINYNIVNLKKIKNMKIIFDANELLLLGDEGMSQFFGLIEEDEDEFIIGHA